MPCRVGVTTDLERCKREWIPKVNGFQKWLQLASYPTKELAQAYENGMQMGHQCEAASCGDDADGPWHVYHFHFDSEEE